MTIHSLSHLLASRIAWAMNPTIFFRSENLPPWNHRGWVLVSIHMLFRSML